MSSPQFKLRYLLNFQRQRSNIQNIGNYGELSFKDIKRIDSYIKGNIFVPGDCCLYKGEIKKKYSTISYKGKKVSVLRLLLHNYVDDVIPEDVLEHLCTNAGICCNLHHFKIKGKDNNIEFDDIYEDYDNDPFSKTSNIKNIKKPIFTEETNTEITDDYKEKENIFDFD